MTDTDNDPPPEVATTAKPVKKQRSETLDFAFFCLKLIIAATLIRSVIIEPRNVPTESLVPNIVDGDYLFVAKWPYGYSKYSFPFAYPLFDGRFFPGTPERGDVAVFRAPPDNQKDYIKRIIGIPGDRIQMKAGQLWLNGKPIPKRRIDDFLLAISPNTRQCTPSDKVEQSSDGSLRCRYPRFVETLPGGKSYEVLDTRVSEGDTTQEFTVPEGFVFAMGDNRDNSADSRFAPGPRNNGIGLVPMDNLQGRAMFKFFSTDGSAKWLLPWTWFTAARWDRIGSGF